MSVPTLQSTPASAAQEAVDDLWDMALRHRSMSPSRLLSVIPIAATHSDLDERTKMLIHDALDAIAAVQGREIVEQHLNRLAGAAVVRTIWNDIYDKVGFPTFANRIMEPITPQFIRDYLRELGKHVHQSTTMTLAGSAVLILHELVIRRTEDIDVLDEIPAVIREQHETLRELREDTHLQLAHTASHYYPEGWQRRTSSIGRFGDLEVRLLDPIDLLVGKLFSLRKKDMRDIRDAWGRIDHQQFRDRLARCTRGLRQVRHVADKAKENWYILSGEDDLPPLIEESASA